MDTARSDESIRKVVVIRARANQVSALRGALKALEQATRAEPGCQEFTFYQALSSENVFLLIERFADSGAFAEHMQLPHTRRFFQAQLTDSIDALEW